MNSPNFRCVAHALQSVMSTKIIKEQMSRVEHAAEGLACVHHFYADESSLGISFLFPHHINETSETSAVVSSAIALICAGRFFF